MNKGRNIGILILSLVALSLLTFLVNLNRSNSSGIVDNVRYYQTESTDESRTYEFYFVEGDNMTGTLYTGDDSYSVVINDYDYSYTLTGTSREDAKVTAASIEDDADLSKAYDLFTEDFLISMVYGGVPVLSVTQAIIVAMIAIAGALILGKNEEIWAFFNKDESKEYPEYSELKKYKVSGGAIMIASAVLLLVFVIF